MRVLYADPSFTCTGLFEFDTETKALRFDRIRLGFGTLRKHENYLRAGLAVADAFGSILQSRKPSVLKIEIPPPMGQTAAGLTGLNYLLMDRALRCGSIERTELITPSFISRMQETYFGAKSKRSLIAHAILERLGQQGDLGTPGRTGVEVTSADLLDDNDVATAFLFFVFERIKRMELRQEIAERLANPRAREKRTVDSIGLSPLSGYTPFQILGEGNSPKRGINTTTSPTTTKETTAMNNGTKAHTTKRKRKLIE